MKRICFIFIFLSLFAFTQEEQILQEITGFIDYTIDENARENCKLPTMKVDGKFYKIMLNPKYIIDEEIKSGDKILLKGIIKESQWQNDDSFTIFVREIVFKEKVIKIDAVKTHSSKNQPFNKDKAKKLKK